MTFFNIEYAGVSLNGAVNRLFGAEGTCVGECVHGYTTSGYAANQPDHQTPLEGATIILTCNEERNRGIYYDGDGAFRTYAQSVSFVGINNAFNFNRADMLVSILDELAGYQGHLTGQVLNNKTNEPVAEATVSIPDVKLNCLTDEEGRFDISRIPIEQFSITVLARGYTDFEEADFSFNGENEANLEIRMLHPEILISPMDISSELPQNNTEDLEITITNEGDGPLEFDSRIRPVQVEGQLWEEIESFNLGVVTGDSRLQASVFIDGHYWVAGGNSSADERNMLYKVTAAGELVGQWEQESESNYGWRDMTTDGEFIYGVDAEFIAQIDPETGLETGNRIVSQYLPRPTYCITYNPEADIFWVAGPTTSLFGFDRNGRWIDVVNNNGRFRPSGLAWYADDPDGYQLYIVSQDRNRRPLLVKCNYETEELMDVRYLDDVEGEQPGGGDLTTELYPFTASLVLQMQGRDDWVRTFEAGTKFDWVSLTPNAATVDAESATQLNLRLDPSGLIIGEQYDAFIQVQHNTIIEGVLWINVNLSVLDPTIVVSDDAVPLTFGISSVYPNPFNPETTIKFSLESDADISLSVYDLSGREISVLVNDRLSAGEYSIPFTAHSLPSGVYLLRLSDNRNVSMQKITLMK